MSKYLPKNIKEEVARRAKFCCEYCLSQVNYSPDSFVIEHIVPSVLGGNDTLENLAYACQGCNNHKFISIESIDITTGRNVPLFNPRKDSWNVHFEWNIDKSLIIGLTAIGRATIGKLKLNRNGVCNLRQVLRSAGKHPPF
jgi:hypothetical protein